MRSGVFLAACAVMLGAAPASACGGFFCNNQQPVVQAGEHVLFAVDETTVTAHIQITYQGLSEDFSWVLPLPSVPDFGVGTDNLFTVLHSLSDPSFRTEWLPNEQCAVECSMCPTDGGLMDAAGAPQDMAAGDTGAPVIVLKEGDVGPYQFKVVESSDGQALFDWLNDNGYDQPESAKGLVTHYVNVEYKFVALKLQKDKSAGDLQPLVVTYEAPDLACIPLKLTSIAASPDMPVFTWVLARARAVPMNFFHVLLNAKAFDWLRCGTPTGELSSCGQGYSQAGSQSCWDAYVDLVTEAADQAGGHAFVTEFAGSTSIMANQLGPFPPEISASLSAIEDPAELLSEIIFAYQSSLLLLPILRTHVPWPDGAPQGCQSYAPESFADCLNTMPEGWVLDAAALLAEIDERIVQPPRDAQKLFDNHPYMTRLFTTVSPEEMTKDPLFSFNPDLPDVDIQHEVTATPWCGPGGGGASGMQLTWADGSTSVVDGTFDSCGGFSPDGSVTDPDDPAAAAIQVLGESGGPLTVAAGDVDEREAEIETRRASPGAAERAQSPTANQSGHETGTFGVAGRGPAGGGSGGARTRESGGCSPAAGSTPAAALALLLLTLALLGRRGSPAGPVRSQDPTDAS